MLLYCWFFSIGDNLSFFWGGGDIKRKEDGEEDEKDRLRNQEANIESEGWLGCGAHL